MSKRAIITLVALMLSIVSTSTSALANKETDDLLQSWRMELRFTPYKPKISQNATKQAFYDLMYGDSEPVMTTFATHHYLWKGFGLLGGMGFDAIFFKPFSAGTNRDGPV